MKVSLIAAMARNRVIGNEGGLPWSLPKDLQHFRALTLHKTVVMGHATARSLGKPLPHRTNLVLSRNVVTLPGFIQMNTRDEAVRYAEQMQAEELCVIGGAQIYELFLPIATHLEMTHIESDVTGDTFFPFINCDEWLQETSRTQKPDDKHAYGLRMTSYQRK